MCYGNRLQRQVDCLSGLGVAVHGFRPLHVMDTRFEGCHRDFFDAPNRVDELLFHPVIGLLRTGVRDFSEFRVTTVSGKDVLPAIDVYGALAAVDPCLIAGR